MILIVDDDCAVRDSLGLMLKVAGMEYTAVANAADALAAVRGDNVGLVILDMNLRRTTDGRDGIELLRKIRILKPEVPVILISAWGTIPLAVEGMNYGAVDFVSKPWSNRDLLAKIRSAIAKAAPQPVPTLEQVERDTIMRALRNADGNLRRAAEELGITRQSLYRRMEKLGL
ncbi:MAG: DNA-binding response regulator [Muribaculaceae bacterium]|nr:DNA-binding response regulator [Muribaculaceae bacterium]MDE6130157.1 DNA-binding response regulator [Muribaculaceae bacterium]